VGLDVEWKPSPFGSSVQVCACVGESRN